MNTSIISESTANYMMDAISFTLIQTMSDAEIQSFDSWEALADHITDAARILFKDYCERSGIVGVETEN